MEFQIWDKKGKYNKLIRYSVIISLTILLVFYTIYFESFNRYLSGLHTEPVIPFSVWLLITKLLSYCINIFINFSILLAVSNRFQYSLTMVYTSFVILFAGALLIFLKNKTDLPISLATITLFVKINKSLVLLVIFIAGHVVSNQKRL